MSLQQSYILFKIINSLWLSDNTHIPGNISNDLQTFLSLCEVEIWDMYNTLLVNICQSHSECHVKNDKENNFISIIVNKICTFMLRIHSLIVLYFINHHFCQQVPKFHKVFKFRYSILCHKATPVFMYNNLEQPLPGFSFSYDVNIYHKTFMVVTLP